MVVMNGETTKIIKVLKNVKSADFQQIKEDLKKLRKTIKGRPDKYPPPHRALSGCNTNQVE